jgi:hypothetical protein
MALLIFSFFAQNIYLYYFLTSDILEMASDDMMPALEDQKNLYSPEIERTSKEFIQTDPQDSLLCQKLFDKFKDFNQETTAISDSENMKKRLRQSISLWNELLTIATNANEKNKCYFDQNRVLVLRVFSDATETDLFNNDSEFSREIFFGYLDILNTNEIQQFLTASSPSTLADAIRESNVDILLSVLSFLCKFVSFVDDNIANNYNCLFNAMRLHAEQKLQNAQSQPSTNKKSASIHQRILSLIWNFSDLTVNVPSLLRAGFGKSVLEWLNYPILADTDRRPMVSIVHNLSRHDDGADELNKYGAIETINRLQQLDVVRQSKMALLNTMALALLSTPDQIKANPTGTKTILDQLLQITMAASTAERYRYNDFHVSEPLAVLVRLFVDDATFDYVMNQAKTNPPSNLTSTIKLFSDLLIHFCAALTEKDRLEQFTVIALFNILWSISFHEECHEILKQNTELIDTIKDVAKNDSQIIIEQYVPRSMQSVKKAADGILFNLGLELPVLALSIANSVVVQQKPLVMLSYSHANNEFCDRILELLDQKADLFDIWIDKRCCKSSADVWESIAKGIKNAQLIVCIVSSEYLASKACRQEIIYAKDRLNKPFLPVYLEKPDVSDWLGKTSHLNFLLLFVFIGWHRYSTCRVQICSFSEHTFET